MERDLWSRLMRAVKRLPATRPRGAVYWDREVLCVALWGALHDRPVDWACRRRNWPRQAWRRRLPDQSTMSRRLRHPEIVAQLRQLVAVLYRGQEASPIMLMDGKALELSEHSRDPDARVGRGVSGYAKGYKLHALIDERQRLLAWCVRPLNEAECVVARTLLRDAAPHLSAHALLLADASYDSNRLHLRASVLGVQMIAPRRKSGRGLSRSHRQHRSRLRSIAFTEGRGSAKRMRWFRARRGGIERFFGTLACVGGGLSHLPAWARRIHRCEIWVGAKLAVHAARLADA